MKTNLANLMSIVAEEERKFASYGYELKNHAYNTSAQELNGTMQILKKNLKSIKIRKKRLQK